MDANETCVIGILKRSVVRSFFFLFLVVGSITSMAACSDDDGKSEVIPNYIVQASVSVQDDELVAFALVMDRDKNLVSTLDLSINGVPMAVEYFEDADGEGSDSGGVFPYYILELTEPGTEDKVVFQAVHTSGEIIYAPEPAIIPTAIEILEPQEGQEIMAGDEVFIRWTGGEGAELFLAGYAPMDGSVLFLHESAPGERETLVPVGQTVAGAAMVGVGAISGDIAVIDTFDGGLRTDESYLLVSRAAGIDVVVGAESDTSEAQERDNECPFSGGGFLDAHYSCSLQWMMGFSDIWKEHLKTDLEIEGNAPCGPADYRAMTYCRMYVSIHGDAKTWHSGCLACAVWNYYSETDGKCLDPDKCLDSTKGCEPQWQSPRSRACLSPCEESGLYYYCGNGN